MTKLGFDVAKMRAHCRMIWPNLLAELKPEDVMPEDDDTPKFMTK